MATASSLLRAELRDFATRYKLSPREHDVVFVLATGTSRIQAIADQLMLSQNTVHNHLKSIFRKTATGGKAELLALFLGFNMQRQAGRRPFVKRPRVLIVDDDRDLGEALCRTLEHRGIFVDHESDPRRALERLASRWVDVAVLDVEMPDVSGLELLQQIRQRQIREPALFVMTGEPSYTAEYCKALGAQAFFRKPVDADELTFAIFEQSVESPYERNRFVRVDVDLPVLVNGAVALCIDNIGFGGAFLVVPSEQLASNPLFRSGQRIHLEIRLDEQVHDVRVEGVVVWQRVALRPFERSGVGIEFVALRDASRTSIEAFVRRQKLLGLAPWMDERRNHRT